MSNVFVDFSNGTGTADPALPPYLSFFNAAPQLPVSDSLTDGWWPRRGTDPYKNFYNPTNPLIAYGAPVLNDTYATVGVGKHLATGVKPGKYWTCIIMSALRGSGVASGYDISNFGDDGMGDTLGSAGGALSPNNIYATAGTSVKSGGVSVPATDPGFYFTTGIFSDTPSIHLWNGAGKVGFANVSMGGVLRVAPPVRELVLGRSYASSSPLGPRNIGLILVFNRVLTVAEADANCAYLSTTWANAWGVDMAGI
jgi:hypothetical protein